MDCVLATAAQLTAHLQSQHAERLQETLHLKELLQWTLFMELGCFCNPSGGWGEAHHECVGLSQLAFVIQDFGWQVLVPWTFSSTDLTTVVGAFATAAGALACHHGHDDKEFSPNLG